jgi:hypothetical protein
MHVLACVLLAAGGIAVGVFSTLALQTPLGTHEDILTLLLSASVILLLLSVWWKLVLDIPDGEDGDVVRQVDDSTGRPGLVSSSDQSEVRGGTEVAGGSHQST